MDDDALTTILGTRADVEGQIEHLGRGVLFVPPPEPLPQPLEELALVIVAGSVEHEVRARVVQIVPSVGVALECSGAPELSVVLGRALGAWAGDSGTSFSQWGRPSSGSHEHAIVADVTVDEDFDARPTVRPPEVDDAPVEPVDSDPPTMPETATEPNVPPAAPLPESGEPSQDDPNVPLAERIKTMSTSEKRQLALHGDKAARTLLLNDPNKTIHAFIIRNNNLTIDEVRYIAGFRQTNPDVLKQISENREWMKNPRVIAALVANPKTPTTVATKLVGKLPIQEIRRIARSQSIPRAVSAVAKKLVIGD